MFTIIQTTYIILNINKVKDVVFLPLTPSSSACQINNISKNCTVTRGQGEDSMSHLPMSWTLTIRGSSPVSPVLGMYHSSHNGSSFQGLGLKRKMCCWNHLDDWTQRRSLYKILAGRYRDLFVLPSPKTSLTCKLPCLLKLPPTSLAWPTSFFDLSLPSM